MGKVIVVTSGKGGLEDDLDRRIGSGAGATQ